MARNTSNPVSRAGLPETPHRTNAFIVVLVVVVLIAIVEVLFPRVVAIVLGGTPIVVGVKSSSIRRDVVIIITSVMIM